MYDRLTGSVWHQFTGEPVIGPLAGSGAVLDFFPILLTTWQEWAAEHPDSTVLSLETGIFPPNFYVPESDERSTYYDYFNSPETMFTVWKRSPELETKDVVLGVGVGDSYKAYPVAALNQDRVVNDELGGSEIVVIASSSSQAARAYARAGQQFALSGDHAAAEGLPKTLVDAKGLVWQVTEEGLVSSAAPSQTLQRIPTNMAFWFGWYQFHPDTEVYRPPP